MKNRIDGGVIALLMLVALCLTTIEGYALYQGINGVGLSAFVAAMAAIFGFWIGRPKRGG